MCARVNATITILIGYRSRARVAKVAGFPLHAGEAGSLRISGKDVSVMADSGVDTYTIRGLGYLYALQGALAGLYILIVQGASLRT